MQNLHLRDRIVMRRHVERTIISILVVCSPPTPTWRWSSYVPVTALQSPCGGGPVYNRTALRLGAPGNGGKPGSSARRCVYVSVRYGEQQLARHPPALPRLSTLLDTGARHPYGPVTTWPSVTFGWCRLRPTEAPDVRFVFSVGEHV